MASPSSALPPRQRQILIALCRQYALSGRPVASATLRRTHRLDWSSATIRGELAALERAGLVHKAHAASGRTPTAAGWRVYVDALPRGSASPEHRRLLDVGLGEHGGDLRRGLRSTARVLSELAGCVAIGFVGEPRPGRVRALELVPLAGEGGRLLVMLGLDDGASSVRTVDVDRTVLEEEGELRRIQGLLRDLTLGRSLTEARDALRDLLAAERERVDRCMGEALRIGMMLCVASFDPLWMQVAGHGSLVHGEQTSGDVDSMAALLDLLEDYQRLAEILCQLLPDPGPHASICVDLGTRVPLGSASGLTLVGCRLRWPGQRTAGEPGEGSASAGTGAVALLGSPRMDYEAVIPLVEYAARAMAARA